MKKYKIVGKVILSCVIDNDQYDIPYDNRSYIDHLLTDGKTVWMVLMDDTIIETVTNPDIIETGLKDQVLKEIL